MARPLWSDAMAPVWPVEGMRFRLGPHVSVTARIRRRRSREVGRHPRYWGTSVLGGHRQATLPSLIPEQLVGLAL